MNPSAIRTACFSSITMVAFAMNSVLGRLALSGDSIDPASYTAIRLCSGAIMLGLLVSVRGGLKNLWTSGASFGSTSISTLALFIYAAFFSFAYLSIDAGVGALILFAFVQAVMIGWGLFTGERPSFVAWIGVALAFGGFIYLVSPGLAAPDPFGSILMAMAGVAWGIYSLRGRGQADPLATTARNFIFSIPLTILLVILFASQQKMETQGVILAIISGAVTSALGYALWYETLKGLTATKAAILQLTAPLIATFIGVGMMGEQLSARLIIASALILGGVAIAITSKQKGNSGPD